MEENKRKLKVPKFMNMPWLTRDYVMKNAWYPVCDEWLQNSPKKSQYNIESEFSRVPWRSRSEFKSGDIIIFNEYDEWEEDGEFYSDRFLIITEEDIREYHEGARNLLPVGVVVHSPA